MKSKSLPEQEELYEAIADYITKLKPDQAEKLREYPGTYANLNEYKNFQESGYRTIMDTISGVGGVVAIGSIIGLQFFPLLAGGLTYLFGRRISKNILKDKKGSIIEAMREERFPNSEESLEDLIRRTTDPRDKKQIKAVDRIYNML
jgi:hypothetical protein